MSDFSKKVMVGNVVLYPDLLRNCLKKSHYYLTYNQKDDVVTFWVNDKGEGGKVIFEIRNIPQESAEKLARELGLKPDFETLQNRRRAVSWSKYNPYLILNDDGSENAQILRNDLFLSGIPFKAVKSRELGLSYEQHYYGISGWSFEGLRKIIKDMKKDNLEELSTSP